MQLADIVAESQDGQGLSNLARQFNLDEDQVRAAIDQLGPAVMAGVRQEAQSPDGLSGLLEALADGDHARYLDGDGTGITADGNAILGHIFGSKDVSSGVAAHAAASTGIGASIMKKMLPVIAAMVMGYLAKKMGGGASGGGLGGVLGQVLGGGSANAGSSSGGGLGDILGQVLGGGSASAGSSSGGGLGDILGQVLGGGSAGAGSSSGGGLGDILGQVLGGSQRSATTPAGGGLSDILNGIFGKDAAPEIRQKAMDKANSQLGGLLGAGTEAGNDGDQLLRSVREALARR
ncbi:MAG: DUF937 domain-containing protein [Rhizobiales bacterium]|nr:DUF937 domain-containing protein [Hyphomicrobiales bacterium]